MGLKAFDLEVVHRVPEELDSGKLYVCFDCNVVVHLCACGCGERVVLPIDPEFWSVTYNGETTSLYPSIGNFQFPCKSHYWIKNNRVIWVPEEKEKVPHSKKRKRKKKNIRDWVKSFL
jgi:hypothetical protein